MGASEIVILLIVGIVVVGPKKLPGMMKTAGQWITRLRRMSQDLRSNSGIDRIIREEGLEKEIRELRELRLALSRNNILDKIVEAANAPPKPIVRPTPAVAATSSAALPAGGKVPQSSAPVEPKLASSSETNGSAPAATNPALSLIKPAQGAIAQGSLVDLPSDLPDIPYPSPERAYRSVRQREYPKMGCDHYDVLPDDLDEAEADAEALEVSDAKSDTAKTDAEKSEVAKTDEAKTDEGWGDDTKLATNDAQGDEPTRAPVDPVEATKEPSISGEPRDAGAEVHPRGVV